MQRVAAMCILVATAFGGCTSPTPQEPTEVKRDPEDVPQDAPLVVRAPWWDAGDRYTVRLTHAGAEPTVWPMVNFLNDSATHHFWLGVADRSQALSHALFNVNPFLGRVHHDILSPHETGIHAGMYSFPLSDGKRWNGFYFGRNWSFVAQEGMVAAPSGEQRGFNITGTGTDTDAHTLAFNYVPSVRWLTRMEERDNTGTVTLRAEVESYEKGVSGTYVFLRGVDFYAGPALSGPHEEKFEVSDEVDSLAFHADASATGLLRIDLVDPELAIRATFMGTDGKVSGLHEVTGVQTGEWTVRYLAAGAIEGTVLATGLLETKGTV